jgi:hypothetical protein
MSTDIIITTRIAHQGGWARIDGNQSKWTKERPLKVAGNRELKFPVTN